MNQNGNLNLEKIPQKEFLQNKGFELVCEDVTFADCDTVKKNH